MKQWEVWQAEERIGENGLRGLELCQVCAVDYPDAEMCLTAPEDYDDMDCDGSTKKCDSCSEDLFPGAWEERQAQMLAEYGRPPMGWRPNRMAVAADPEFYAGVKENPEQWD